MPTQATITATIADPSGTALTSAAFVRFRLRGFQGFVPRVSGTSIVCETQIDAQPNGSGAISQALWKNSDITPPSTFWTVEFYSVGRITSSGNYIFNANTDLDSASQINAPPVPSGFSLVLENNGALNSSQSTLNLESLDNSVVITDEGLGNINLAVSSSGSPDSVLSALWLPGNAAVGPFVFTNDGHQVSDGGASNTFPSPTASTNYTNQQTGNRITNGSTEFYGGRNFTFKLAGGVMAGSGGTGGVGFGLADASSWWNANNGIPNTGNFVMFVAPTNNTVWQVMVSNGVSTTTVSTGVSTTTRAKFEIDYTPASIAFKINGSTVATVTSNIPTTASMFMVFEVYSFASMSLTAEYLYCAQPSV